MRVCALAILFFAAIAAVNCEVFYEENFKDGRFFLCVSDVYFCLHHSVGVTFEAGF